MNFKEEATKLFNELLAEKEKTQTVLNAINAQLRPLQDYMETVGLIEKKKRGKPQPTPLPEN
jgi:hypothetical protein